MSISLQVAHQVRNASDAGEVRRRAITLAREAGLDETECGRVALIATEAATNLAKHAKDGELLMSTVTRRGRHGIELLALDRGPGMTDVAHCLRDGYSTAGSPGTGLGAITRLATEFDIHSAPDVGTAVLARVLGTERDGSTARAGIEVGAVCLPIAGEAVCGDDWHCLEREQRAVLLVADGLGHGPLASNAAKAAVAALIEHSHDPLDQLLRSIHTALRGTRGAAVALAEICPQEARLRFVGIGNISATIVSPEGSRSLVSLSGIVGEEMRRVQVFEYPWPSGARLIVHSDGLTGRWDLRSYNGLIARDPSVIAGVLYRDYRRGRDDATVVVLRQGGDT